MKRKLPLQISVALVGLFVTGVVAIVAAYPAPRAMGEMFEADRQLDEAIQYFQEWVQDYPSDYNARWHLVSLQMDIARPEDATVTLKGMLADWPNDSAILERLVEIEDSLLGVDSVIPHLEALAELGPATLERASRLADHYRWVDNRQGWQREVAKVRTLKYNVQSVTELADKLIQEKKYDELVGLLREDLEEGNLGIEGRVALSKVYARLGETWLTEYHLRRLITLDPVNQIHFQTLVYEYVDSGRMDEVYELLKTHLDPVVLQVLGDRKTYDLYLYVSDRLADGGRRRDSVRLQQDYVAALAKSVAAKLAVRKDNDSGAEAVDELRTWKQRYDELGGGKRKGPLGKRLKWARDVVDLVSSRAELDDAAETQCSTEAPSLANRLREDNEDVGTWHRVMECAIVTGEHVIRLQARQHLAKLRGARQQ